MKKAEIKVGMKLAVDTNNGNAIKRYQGILTKAEVVKLDAEVTRPVWSDRPWRPTGKKGTQVKLLEDYGSGIFGRRKGDTLILTNLRSMMPWDEYEAARKAQDAERAAQKRRETEGFKVNVPRAKDLNARIEALGMREELGEVSVNNDGTLYNLAFGRSYNSVDRCVAIIERIEKAEGRNG